MRNVASSTSRSTRAEEELWCSWSTEEGVGEADAGAGAGAAARRVRRPSPWLAPIERTIVQLNKAAAPTPTSDVAARVAELRQRLVGEGEGG